MKILLNKSVNSNSLFLTGRKVITILFAAIAVNTACAQDSPFQQGTNVLSAGIGLGGHFGLATYGSQTPGISVHFEHGMWDAGGSGIVSLGGYIGFKSYKYEYVETGYHYPSYYNYTISEKWSYTIVGVRSAFHWNGVNSDTWDVYGGLMISDNILNYKYTDNDPYYGGVYNGLNGSYGSFISLTAFVGGRYFFSDNVGAFAELGYGVSYLNLGFSFKF